MEVWVLPGKDLSAGGSQLLFVAKFLSLLFQKPKLSAQRVPRKVTEPACTLYSPKWSISSHVRPFFLPTQHCQSHDWLNWSISVQQERTATQQSWGGALVFGTNTPSLLTFRESFQSITMLLERAGSISGPNRSLIHLQRPFTFYVAKHSSTLTAFKDSSKYWV